MIRITLKAISTNYGTLTLTDFFTLTAPVDMKWHCVNPDRPLQRLWLREL